MKLSWPFLAAAVGFGGVDAAPANAAINIRAVLSASSWSSGTVIAYPGSQRFLNSTSRWTVFDPPTYTAVITPGTEADIVQAVRIAKANKVPFLATGGRHGFGTALGKLDDGIAIDLSSFDSVRVDATARTLTVGGGTRFESIYDPVYAAGFEMPIGSCSCPGVVGVTLGGGIGRYQSLHGLLIDSLVSVRLITANGGALTVSATSNSDLFWGLRGAGANLGIIASATYKLSPRTGSGSALSMDFVFPAEKSEAYFNALQGFQHKTPRGLSSINLIVYDEATSGAQILSAWVYAGAEAEGRRIMKPILDLNPPFVNATMIPWNRLVYDIGFGLNSAFCQGNAIRSIYGISMKTLAASTYQAAFEEMSAFYEQVPAARGSAIEIELLGSTTAIRDDQTAYPWRDAIAYAMVQMTWTDASMAETSNKIGRKLRDSLARSSGYSGLATYVNYAHGDESVSAIYGSRKLARLAALKNKWDPDNAFGYHNALPKSYP
ncbi:hypothetical protein S40288_09082 [Stachybotrys chartarum IBT 40288]|nr:hypothetical protein S40288_09082 [Stachybotrys chartarum IBT 40288]